MLFLKLFAPRALPLSLSGKCLFAQQLTVGRHNGLVTSEEDRSPFLRRKQVKMGQIGKFEARGINVVRTTFLTW